MKILDMQLMRYLNLFEKITHIRTKYCFIYNGEIIFIVPREFLSKSIGEDGRHVKKLVEILGKKVKIASIPHGDEDVRDFISALIHPIRFKAVETTPTEIIINAGKQSKAMLIGRNKTRLGEMQEIIKEYFNKEVKII